MSQLGEYVEATAKYDDARGRLESYAAKLRELSDHLLSPHSVCITGVSVQPPKSVSLGGKREFSENIPTATQLAQAIADCFVAKERRDQIQAALSADELRVLKSVD